MNIRNGSTLTTIFFAVALSSCGGGSGGSGAAAPPVNAAPRAMISVTKTTGYAPLTVDFDGTSSSDSDGSISTYTWHTDDGASYAGSRISHTYTTLGAFSATLTVTDNDGASSATSVTIDVYAQAAGYYTGRVFSNATQSFTEVEVIVGTNHEIHVWDWFDYLASYWGSISMDADRATGTLAAEIWEPGFVFPDGSTRGSVDLDVTVNARQDITGTYAGVGDTGAIDIQYLPELAERPSSLAEVSGTWGYSDIFGFTATLTIGQSGDWDYSDTDGCTGTGQLGVLDSTLNGFQVSGSWNCASLSPPWVGPSLGLVFIDDYYDPGTHYIVFAEALTDGSSSDVWWLERPAQIAAGSKFSNTTAKASTQSAGGTRDPKSFGRRR